MEFLSQNNKATISSMFVFKLAERKLLIMNRAYFSHRWLFGHLLFALLLLGSIESNAQLVYASFPYSTGFESGGFDNSWTTDSSNTNAINIITNTIYAPAHSAPYHLAMGIYTDGWNTNEAWLHIDLSGQTQVELEFWYKDNDDKNPS